MGVGGAGGGLGRCKFSLRVLEECPAMHNAFHRIITTYDRQQHYSTGPTPSRFQFNSRHKNKMFCSLKGYCPRSHASFHICLLISRKQVKVYFV